MPNSGRMFEIVQLLRAARSPLTADAISARLEVTKRTVYRDIAALQAAGVPLEGAAGVGYVMRRGYDLPPLMFTPEEVDAITVGLALIGRTGDKSLMAAGASACAKVGDAVAHDARVAGYDPWLFASPWHAIPEPKIDMRILRIAIREERKLKIAYRDGNGNTTERTLLPLALLYYIDGVILAGFCELRADFRHFRHDRIASCELTEDRFSRDAARLRKEWRLLPDFFDDASPIV
jgi:predicted DNA-binding transcriptional regulator YafY